MQWSTIIPCRDGAKTLRQTLKSILNQSERPLQVVVADDCSIDDTSEILIEFRVETVKYPSREPRSYARVPMLLNMALKKLKLSDYVMISGDDCTYPTNYVSVLTSFMQKDNVDCASGYIDFYNPTSAPSGSGRILTRTLFNKLTPLPENIGWESWILYKTLSLGRKTQVYPIRFQHNRSYSVESTWTFGHSAYVNGSPLLFTLARSFKAMVKREHSPVNCLAITLGHVEYTLRRADRLDTASFVGTLQKQRVKQKIERFLRLI